MRIFCSQFYKNLVAVYLCAVFCFSYTTLMEAIPNHIYVNEGEDLNVNLEVPVSLTLSGQEIAASSILEPKNTVKAQERVESRSDFMVVCKLFGLVPIKEVEVSVIPSQSVYACGRVIGIYGQTKGVLALRTTEVEDEHGVLVNPAENKVLPGDYIYAVNDTPVQTKEELIDAVQQNGQNRIILSLERKGESIEVALDPVCSKEHSYLLGVWVKDDMAGIGTMTYYTPAGKFGALGHGIGDGETRQLLSITDGSIFKMRLMGIQKGENGTPGELEGVIYYGSDNYLGSVESNDEMGIYGMLDASCLEEYCACDSCYEIGYKQEIKEDKAFILSDISGEVCRYDIEIDALSFQAAGESKGIRFHVTDDELIELTGGIVQGMSGSPIIQNGQIIGAVTHVLVNDPTRGYGIFIENMLETTE